MIASSFLPGDQRLVDQIVYELKAQGIFDQFRKECISDVDTKPAYQNLRQRVEGNVSNFLKEQRWKPDMNKNQVREMLRKSITESGYLETGVERIVDQVVNPKINTVFLPKVEEVVYRFLGISKPNKEETKEKEKQEDKKEDNEKKFVSEILPTDLEAVSPESRDEKTGDSMQDGDDAKTEEDESPPFEPLEETSFVHEENSVDSHMSGFSGLISHESNYSNDTKAVQIDFCLQDSQSRNSSDSRLSIITSDDNSKIDTIVSNIIGDESQTKNLKLNDNTNKNEHSNDKNKSDDKKSSSSSSSSSTVYDKNRNSNERQKSKHRDDKDKHRTSGSSKDSKTRHSSSSLKDKDKNRDKKDSRSNSSKNDNKEKDKNRSKEKRSNDTSNNNNNKINKNKEYKSEQKSSKDKDLKRDSNRDKSDKNHSNSNSSKYREKYRHKSLSNNDNKYRKDDKKDYDKYKQKDKDRKKSKDDHYSSKEKNLERRSTDRDSNDGQSKSRTNLTISNNNNNNSSSSNTTTTTNTNIQHKNTQSVSDSGQSENEQNDQSDTNNELFNNKIKLKKSKITSNIHEAIILKKIRKQLAQLEKNNQLSLTTVDVDKSTLISSSISLEDIKKNGIIKNNNYNKNSTKINKYEDKENNPTKSIVVTTSQDNWDAMEKQLQKQIDDCKYCDKANGKTIQFLSFIGNYLNYLEKDLNKSNIITIKLTNKRKKPENCVIIKNNNNDDDDDEDVDEDDNDDDDDEKVTKKRKLKNNIKEKIQTTTTTTTTTSEVTDNSFPLPLSPAESDNSTDKNKDDTLITSKLKLSSQRYSSDDLYKPRSTFSSSRRRCGKNLDK